MNLMIMSLHMFIKTTMFMNLMIMVILTNMKFKITGIGIGISAGLLQRQAVLNSPSTG